MAVLVVITFLAGSSWGPAVSMTPTSSGEACGALKWEVARQIANVGRTNVTGGASVMKDGEDPMVFAGAQGTREMARLSCK